MQSIAIARAINIKSGGAVISPWEIEELTTDWINAFTATTPDTVAAHDQRVANIRTSFFRRHLWKYKH